MGRLLYCIVITDDVDRLRAFYEGGLGLKPREAQMGWTAYGTAGATLAIQAMQEGYGRELKLAFEALDLDQRIAHLQSRGVRLLGSPIDSDASRKVHLRDPEGNLLALVQPKGVPKEGEELALMEATVGAKDFHQTVVFYRDLLGLKVADESELGVEFDTGRTRLAVRARHEKADQPLHSEQAVSFVLRVDDVDSFADAVRERGLHFATAPTEEDFGVYAEIADPDGNLIVLREPAPETPIEEELAAPFEDDTPLRVAIRKKTEHGVTPLTALSVKPDYKPSKAVKKERERAGSIALARVYEDREKVINGPTEPAVATRRPAERPKVRPAIGRLRKAERHSIEVKKQTEAAIGRSKPVKGAANRNAALGRKSAPPKPPASKPQAALKPAAKKSAAKKPAAKKPAAKKLTRGSRSR